MFDENSRWHSCRCFYLSTFLMEGLFMNQYYVVRRIKEKDEKFAVIDALSLDEANAIFEVRYKDFKETMQKGEAFFIFQANEPLTFDENHQVVFPKGRMAMIHKLS
jgi:hypothetical protein